MEPPAAKPKVNHRSRRLASKEMVEEPWWWEGGEVRALVEAGRRWPPRGQLQKAQQLAATISGRVVRGEVRAR